MREARRSLFTLAAVAIIASAGAAFSAVCETVADVYRCCRDAFDTFTVRLVSAMPASDEGVKSPGIVRLIVAKAYKATTEKRERPVIYERFRMCPSC